LDAKGDLLGRRPSIGDPKREFLPRNQNVIDAEFRGMVELWKKAGMPLDENAKHVSYPAWAQTIGGILMVNGFTDFLGNQDARSTQEDPELRGLAVLGMNGPDKWATPAQWATRIAGLGLTKTVIPPGYRDTPEDRTTGTGIVLSAHEDETFVADTDDSQVTMKLLKARRRFEGGVISTRYRFDVLERRPIPADDEV